MKKLVWVALLMALILTFSTVAYAVGYDHVLKEGMRDDKDTFPDGAEEDIKTMQAQLAYYEYYTGKIDGIFGKKMTSAVKAFQQRNNLKVDGRIGANTWAALVATDSVKKSDFKVDNVEIKDESDTTIAIVGFNKLRSGDKGETVKKIQVWLEKLYFLNPNKATEGVFDKETLSAVKGFQLAVGLSSDGIVGQKTYTALEKAFNSPSTYFSESKKIRRNVSSGMRGYDVYIVQKKLEKLHYLSSILNPGYFDQATYQATVDFQENNRIHVTGKLDANTKAALWGESYEKAIVDEDASATSPYDRPKLKLGSHGYYVRSAQNYLKSAGVLMGSADGVFGTKTRDAVIAFQTAKGLKADGVIGAETWAELMGVPLSQGGQGTLGFTDPSTSVTYKVIKRGDSGYSVKHLQEMLYAANLLDLEDIDSKFGKNTEAAVKQFQKEAGLKQDGRVGYNTWSALYHKLGLI